MEFKMSVKLIIIVIALFGSASSSVVREICPEYTKQYCTCIGSEKAKIVPLKMCYSENGCEPCKMELQDHINCSICPGNVCPVCSENAFNLQENDKKKVADVKSLFARSLRKSRSAWDSLPHDFWCVLRKGEIRNGRLECTISSYSKECLLSCYNYYTVNGKRELSFACERKENVWHPEIQDCEEPPGGYYVTGNPVIYLVNKVQLPKIKSVDIHHNDTHFGDKGGAANKAASQYVYDSDDDADDQKDSFGKGKAADSPIISDLPLREVDKEEIDEDRLKVFYDILSNFT